MTASIPTTKGARQQRITEVLSRHEVRSQTELAELPDILGTLAGDDTVLVISRRPDGGPALAERFLALANGSHHPPEGTPQTTPHSTQKESP